MSASCAITYACDQNEEATLRRASEAKPLGVVGEPNICRISLDGNREIPPSIDGTIPREVRIGDTISPELVALRNTPEI
jgi:hypothetical protein